MGFTFTTIQHTIRGLKNSPILRAGDMKIFLQGRQYSRWTHRRPAKVINKEEFFENSNERIASQNILKNAEFAFAERQKIIAKLRTKDKREPEIQNSGQTFHEDGKPVFTKLDMNDPKMSSLMITVKSRKKQKQDDRVLLEGHRLIEDAIKAGIVPEIIIFSRQPDLEKLSLPKEGVKLYKIPYRTIQLWSDLTTSPGLMGIFKTPDISDKEPADDSIPVTIICDNVREPGNLGSILRVAAGAGCERVILTKGCVDLWSPKVLRSAAGAHFRLPIFKSQTWAEIQYLISENSNIVVADNKIKPPTEPLNNSDPSESDSSSDSESSDSELEHEGDAKNILKTIQKDFGEEPSNEDSTIPESQVRDVRPDTFTSRKLAFKEAVANLPIIPYFATQYTENETVVIVGGETEGISEESLALTLRKEGIRVNVPLTNGVDSLNTGTALGVILFEIKRQFLIRLQNI